MNGIIIHSNTEIIAKVAGSRAVCDFSDYITRGYIVTEVDNIFDINSIVEGVPSVELPPPTEAEIIASLTAAVQAKLDSEARTHNYDGILSLCSYATSLDPVFKDEGQAGVDWRDACWRTAYTVMADVKNGLRAVPTSTELIAELPQMIWPN